MRLKLDATRDELEAKGPQLVDALARALAADAPDLAEALTKAAQSATASEPQFPVMRGLRDEMAAAYDRQMQLMVEDIMKVIDRAALDRSEKSGLEKGLRPHRYIRRERHGERWVYYYNDGSHLSSNRIGAPREERSDQTVSVHHEPLSEEELNTVKLYQDSEHTAQLQGTLRNGAHPFGDEVTAQYHGMAKVLEAAIDKHTLESPIITYRGVEGGPWCDKQIGENMVDQGFFSTSVNFNIAYGFAKSQTGPFPVIFHIHLAKGQHALPMNLQSPGHRFEAEEELLLNRESRFTVLSRTKDEDGITHMDIEVDDR